MLSATLDPGVGTGDDTARVDQHRLVPLERVRPRVPLEGLAVDRVQRCDLVAADHLVTEPVAAEALTEAVSDVGEARPRNGSGRRRGEHEVTADVDRDVADRERVDAVEQPRDPERLHVRLTLDRERHRRVVDRGPVAAGAAGHDEVLAVGRDRTGVDALDAAHELEVVLPEVGRPRQQLVGLGADQPDAVAILTGDLAGGVDHEQLAQVGCEHQRLHGHHAVDADATRQVVVEVRDDRAVARVERHQAGAGDAPLTVVNWPPTYTVVLVASTAVAAELALAVNEVITEPFVGLSATILRRATPLTLLKRPTT
jgi:hypothetical protein